jgi:hypothetical protein
MVPVAANPSVPNGEHSGPADHSFDAARRAPEPPSEPNGYLVPRLLHLLRLDTNAIKRTEALFHGGTHGLDPMRQSPVDSGSRIPFNVWVEEFEDRGVIPPLEGGVERLYGLHVSSDIAQAVSLGRVLLFVQSDSEPLLPQPGGFEGVVPAVEPLKSDGCGS